MAAPPRRSRLRLAAAVAVVVVALLVAVAAVVLAVRQRPDAGVLAGVHVEDELVAGLSRDALTDVVGRIARARLEAPVVVTGPHGEVVADRGQVGASMHVDAVVHDAWSRGRRGWAGSLLDHARAALGAEISIEMAESLDEDRVGQWAQDAAAQQSREPVAAAIALVAQEPPRVDVTEPSEGVRVDAGGLSDRLLEALRSGPGRVTVEAQWEVLQPVPSRADLDAVLPLAHRAVSGPIRLVHPLGGPAVELTPVDIAAVIDVRVDEDAAEGQRLGLAGHAERLTEIVTADRATAMTVDPVEATIRLVDGAVVIEGGEPGFRYDADAAAAQVVAVATSDGSREAPLEGERPEPDLTRSEAEALGVRQPVSTFTTEHACCQARVTNIQRFADLVDGTLLLPGDRFSLNDHVGPRTEEKGFVPAGAIVDGEFVDEVGGGVSQFATTFFNAAFFSGIRLVRFQPHSYYISRYPAGRESTLAYGLIDVVVENDSPHGILVETSYTDTSITVTFWSSPWAEVTYRDLGRTNVRPGRQRDGFTIRFFRDVTYPDGTTDTQEWTHHYQPED